MTCLLNFIKSVLICCEVISRKHVDRRTDRETAWWSQKPDFPFWLKFSSSKGRSGVMLTELCECALQISVCVAMSSFVRNPLSVVWIETRRQADRYGLSGTCSCHVLREASCLNVTAFVLFRDTASVIPLCNYVVAETEGSALLVSESSIGPSLEPASTPVSIHLNIVLPCCSWSYS